MKILMTGCTALHVNGPNKSHDYESPFTILSRVLPQMGHEVDWREVDPGEPLRDRYDLALVGIAPLGSLNTLRYKFVALWTAAEMAERAIVVIDDMQWPDVVSSISNGKQLWKSAHMDDSHLRRFDKAAKHSKAIEALRDKWARHGFDACLFTMFRWGDHDFFKRRHPIARQFDWDPTPFVKRYVTSPPQDKMREWSCASLSNHQAWLDFLKLSWPVKTQWKPWVGETKAPKGVKWRISEGRVANEIVAPRWGSLAYPHLKTAGSGWWRVRFNVVVQQTQSVMFADPREVVALGKPFLVTPREVERMTDDELRQLASDQRGVFESYVPDADVERARLDRIFECVVS